jgi:dsDNA-binding SOS-regulon protein
MKKDEKSKMRQDRTEPMPEKAELLEKLRDTGFNVPDFIYISAAQFESEDFKELEMFLAHHKESYKVIARSAHFEERRFKGGTFDSLETYADVGGIRYARKKMIKLARTRKNLSILRQQHFNNAPQIDPEQMGVIVMPFIDGSSVMAKMIGGQWEFGYSRDRIHKVQREPYITRVPHDRRLVKLSDDVQTCMGFRCEIEYIISIDGDIHVVQAKDISDIDTLEEKESRRSIKLDGIRRIRKRRNYRERPLYVMDNKSFYISIISKCEDLLGECSETDRSNIRHVIDAIQSYEKDFETFALKHQRYAVLGLSIQDSVDLYQIANHYLDDTPQLQEELSKALHSNLYQIDIFLSEADTLIAKDKFRINLCSHDAYGIDTVRNPLWTVYWTVERHDEIVRDFRNVGFTTGDTVGIDIDPEEKPTVYRL